MDIVRTTHTAAGAIASAQQKAADMQDSGFLGVKSVGRGIWHAVNPGAKKRYETELRAIQSLPDTIKDIMKMIQEKYAAMSKI
jgi:hypothetical protein